VPPKALHSSVTGTSPGKLPRCAGLFFAAGTPKAKSAPHVGGAQLEIEGISARPPHRAQTSLPAKGGLGQTTRR
jgi:hypothetical protein